MSSSFRKYFRAPPYELFNIINNLAPIIFLDFRTPEEYCISRFVESKLVNLDILNQESNMFDKIDSLIASSSEEFLSLVIVTHSLVDEAIIDKLQMRFEVYLSNEQKAGVVSRQRPSVQNLHYIYFDKFFEIYHRCTALFSFGATGLTGDAAPQHFPPIYFASEIIPNFLFLGDYTNCEIFQLECLGITHVIDASGDRTSERAAAALGLAYQPIDIDDVDSADILSFFSDTNKFIDDSAKEAEEEEDREGGGGRGRGRGGPPRILVHCRAGMSRSATIVIAYLMHASIAKNLKDALRIVIKQRPIVCPNNGFQRQLCRYERSIRGESSFRDEKVLRNWMTLERAGRNRDSI